ISTTGVVLLQYGNRCIFKIALWLRLRDEPLLILCHGLLCKILNQLEKAGITPEETGIRRLLSFVQKSHEAKYMSNLTAQQKLELRTACGIPPEVDKESAKNQAIKKQTTLGQWTKPGTAHEIITIDDDDYLSETETKPPPRD